MNLKENNCKCGSLNRNCPSDNELERNADMLKSLADPTRLKIIYLLKDGELCACNILESIDKSQSTVSHHLNILRKEGILNGRKEGKWIYYSLYDENIIKYLDNFFKLFDK